jgi:transposase
MAEVARQLGIHVNTLHTWVRELPVPGQERPAPRIHRNASYEKVRRLERELKRVTEERDILKKPSPSSPNQRP